MTDILTDPQAFSAALYERMPRLNPGVAEMALYEFRYCLHNITPEGGWDSVPLASPPEIERMLSQRSFYDSIQIKPRRKDQIVLDEKIVELTAMLLAGLVSGAYPEEWIAAHFYFDIRAFFFLHRTEYFTEPVLDHFGGKPYRQFARTHARFASCQDIGYQAFSEANADLDELFIASLKKIVPAKQTPLLLAIAGPTAAGKTEIVERLRAAFGQDGRETTSIELDHFLTDRDQREAKGIHSQGKEALHFDLLQQSLKDITSGSKISIPRYDFIYATSSHNLDGSLKPDGVPIEVEPAEIIFIEGNFPFLLPEIAPLIGLKVVYLTDDPIRMKRKWKRDIDYRKKYHPAYFCNRYFQSQFIMAEIAYRPQLEVCDLAVDTSGGALWATPALAGLLDGGN